MAWWIDGMDVRRCADPWRQDTDEVATPQVRGNVPFRTQHDAMAGQGPVDRNFAMIDCQRATHLDHGLLLSVRQLPVVESAVVFADHDATMGEEVTRFERDALLRQIVG